jgi:hypothetical protein
MLVSTGPDRIEADGILVEKRNVMESTDLTPR